MRVIVKTLKKGPAPVAGALILIATVAVTLSAPLISPHDPNAIHYDAILQGPSWRFLLGTDSVGRDVLSRLIYGARVSFFVGIASVVMSVTAGVFIGMIAGYVGGIVDEVLMRIVDIFLAFPAVVLAIAIVAALGSGTQNVILALALVSWTQFARVARAEVLSKKQLEYTDAARALGASALRINVIHLLPNIVPPIVVLATLNVGTMIVAESGLSFLGLGVQPPQASWGTVLADGRSFLRQAPHITTFAGLVIMIVVLSLNFLGDAFRDALDVRDA